MSYQSEAQLENELMAQLKSQGWKPVVLDDYEQLENNFREQFNNFNRRLLNDKPLSDEEFRMVLAQINNRGVFKSAQILRDKQVLIREDGSPLTYSLFNTKEWCKNRFQLAQQVRTSGDHWNTRYDVTLLINGLPLIQIELKKNGVEVSKAFHQVRRYKEDNSYKGLFNFIQFFIISNGNYTRYFANDDKLLSEAFAFKWTDENNNQYKSLSEFASNFLDKCWAAKMIARYMVVQETDKRLIIMRPYQVYGTEKMVSCALDTGNNGFIWHTTGSGKTLTSFKVSQLIAESQKFKKIFFLVDRRDLNKQTSEEFNHFKKDSISTSDSTYELVQNIKSTFIKDRLILTTIQKFDKALKNPKYASVMNALKNEKVAFVIDECHRSQFGDMQKLIRSNFVNAQHFGFTGTPRFPENKSSDGKTTADIFGQCLHTYLLKDGIRDKNTLAFSVEYVQTLMVKEEIEDPDWEVKGLATGEVWHHKDRISKIVDDIFVDRKRKSHNKKFNAMLTLDSVKAVALYMKAFEDANAQRKDENKLTVATIYSFDDNATLCSGQEHPRAALERYITDYNKLFGTNYDTTDIGRYNSDVADKFKKGLIDVLIVVDMMLTGFDSKILNTLYVDRGFKHHTLVQAYSRTNRVYDGPKPVGHIRCYRNLKDKTDKAVRLFSNVENASEILAKPYEEQKTVFEKAVATFKAKYPNPDDLYDVESEVEKKEFVLAFRDLAGMLRKIETFSEFKYEDFDIDQQTINVYQSHYLDFKIKSQDGEQASILDDIDFKLEQILADTINVDYIYRLLASLDVDDKDFVKKLRDMVRDEGTDKLRKKRDLLLDFIDKVIPTLDSDSNVLDEYHAFLDEKTQQEIAKRCANFGISEEILLRIVSTYRFHGKLDRYLFQKKTTLGWSARLEQEELLEKFVLALAETFETEE